MLRCGEAVGGVAAGGVLGSRTTTGTLVGGFDRRLLERETVADGVADGVSCLTRSALMTTYFGASSEESTAVLLEESEGRFGTRIGACTAFEEVMDVFRARGGAARVLEATRVLVGGSRTGEAVRVEGALVFGFMIGVRVEVAVAVRVDVLADRLMAVEPSGPH